MSRIRSFAPTWVCLLMLFTGLAQQTEAFSVEKQTLLDSTQIVALSFEEYLGYVKKYHPLMKQANLRLTQGEAKLLKARGGFDPKIAVDYDRKKFKGTEYYDILNATFKIPTWYGLDFKAKFEENTGKYLDPSLTVPEGGLYSAGVSISLAQGLLINERMAALKKGRFFLQQSKADRDLLLNNLVFDASIAYFKWLEAANELKIYENFSENTRTRLAAVKRSVEEGDIAAIDSIEARISLRNRNLNLEAAKLKIKKASLKASNYLWINDIPLILEENVRPRQPSVKVLETVLTIRQMDDERDVVAEHPKIKSLDAKIEGLKVSRNLKRNKLLPKVDLEYNFLSADADRLASFSAANYKAYVNVSVPIFLRKERGDVKLADFKLQDAKFARRAKQLSLKNKIDAVYAEISSLDTQGGLIKNLIDDYATMVNAEERKFFMGESSVFLINSREQKLLNAQLKENVLLIKRLNATAELFKAIGR